MLRLANWFSGSLHLLNPHRPLADLPRLNPLLRRELKLPRTAATPQDVELPLYDTRLFRLGCLAQIIGLSWLCGFSFTVFDLDIYTMLLAAYVIPLSVISVGADLYATIRYINQLHQAHRRETWDSLRLAMANDQEFVRSFEAIGVVNAWSALQLDLTLRAIPAAAVIGASAITALIGAASLLGVGLSLLSGTQQLGTVVGQNTLEFLTTILLALVILRLGTLFIGDSLLRFRLNASFSMLCATAIRDTTAAIAVSVAGILGLRLLHVIGIAILYNLTREIGAGRYPANLGETISEIVYIGWLALLILFAIPVTSNLFAALRGGFERLTLRAIQSGD